MTDYFNQITSDLLKKSPLYIKVKVLPKSPKNEITDQMEDGTYKIRIKAPATDGKANAELIRFLKKEIKVSEVIIVSGQRDRVKLIRITV
jgi:uncharacterized protein (TIGR00251 family)